MLLHYHISRTESRTETVRSAAFFHNELTPTDSMPLLVRFQRPIEKAKGGATTQMKRQPP